ncbi:MAG: hypothetical protein ACD_71C00028G0003 [uncultured bacterium (gcode 4)]|uniref:Uncharacterized protein n=1 Tax=uncultured bacterium (gcode 4) TaxID=1234023 RepID=K1Z691_9BACT|nr:MAG: hypothetical protein ACD_71C00028G0003 [uncultured bacterium (gcode 4)]
MSTITIDIPETKKSQYETIFHALINEYSIEDIEDFMLGLHMSRNDSISYPIANLRNKYASKVS